MIVINRVISFRLLFGKKLAMDGQNFKNFVITILQVNKINSVSLSVSQIRKSCSQSVIQTDRPADSKSVGQSIGHSDSQTMQTTFLKVHKVLSSSTLLLLIVL